MNGFVQEVIKRARLLGRDNLSYVRRSQHGEVAGVTTSCAWVRDGWNQPRLRHHRQIQRDAAEGTSAWA
jgi:hypothetical protein